MCVGDRERLRGRRAGAGCAPCSQLRGDVLGGGYPPPANRVYACCYACLSGARPVCVVGLLGVVASCGLLCVDGSGAVF